MITERLMAIGQWELTLLPDTPRGILNALDLRTFGFGHIVITPTHMKLGLGESPQGQERFSGIYRRRPDDYVIGGPTANAWVSDEDGKGESIVDMNPLTQSWSFSTWRDNLTPSALFDSSLPSPAGTFAKRFVRVSRREAIDIVSRRFGTEWIVRPDFTLDWGLPADMFVTDPRVVITRRASGTDYLRRNVLGRIEHTADLEDWTQKVMYFVGTEDSATQTNAEQDSPAYYRNPKGAPIIMDRIIEDFSGTSDGALSLAQAQLGRFDHMREDIRLSGLDYDLGDSVSVGDAVYVYDYERGIYDESNTIAFRGGWIHPVELRVVGHTWPVRDGMGVYFRRYQRGQAEPLWSHEYLDLTPWIQWETSNAELEVGDPPRSFIYGN